MKKYLAGEWAEIKTWLSIWASLITAALLATIPVIADHWPDLAPTFISFFPKHGQQLAPIVGVVFIAMARLISQAAVIEGFRRLRDHFFRRRFDADQGGKS